MIIIFGRGDPDLESQKGWPIEDHALLLTQQTTDSLLSHVHPQELLLNALLRPLCAKQDAILIVDPAIRHRHASRIDFLTLGGTAIISRQSYLGYVNLLLSRFRVHILNSLVSSRSSESTAI